MTDTDTEITPPPSSGDWPELLTPDTAILPDDAEEVLAIHGGALMQNRRVYQTAASVAHYVGYHGSFELKDVWPLEQVDRALHLVVRAYNAEARSL
jgi:hypothetical protein